LKHSSNGIKIKVFPGMLEALESKRTDNEEDQQQTTQHITMLQQTIKEQERKIKTDQSQNDQLRNTIEQIKKNKQDLILQLKEVQKDRDFQESKARHNNDGWYRARDEVKDLIKINKELRDTTRKDHVHNLNDLEANFVNLYDEKRALIKVCFNARTAIEREIIHRDKFEDTIHNELNSKAQSEINRNKDNYHIGDEERVEKRRILEEEIERRNFKWQTARKEKHHFRTQYTTAKKDYNQLIHFNFDNDDSTIQ
jgi:chromosome segregation ATPase